MFINDTLKLYHFNIWGQARYFITFACFLGFFNGATRKFKITRAAAVCGSHDISTGQRWHTLWWSGLCAPQPGKPWCVPRMAGKDTMSRGSERRSESSSHRGQRVEQCKIRQRPGHTESCLLSLPSSIRFILCFLFTEASLALKFVWSVIYFKSIYGAPTVC